MIFSLIVLTVSYVRNCASIQPEPVPEFGKMWTQLRYPPDFPTVKTLFVYACRNTVKNVLKISLENPRVYVVSTVTFHYRLAAPATANKWQKISCAIVLSSV